MAIPEGGHRPIVSTQGASVPGREAYHPPRSRRQPGGAFLDGPPRVLVVDDDAAIRDLLTKSLTLAELTTSTPHRMAAPR